MTTAEHEAERKFLVPPGWAVPALPALGAWTEPRRHDLRAEYFDTPEYDLTRAGWSLRHRTGGDDAGWHLKRPVATDVRREEWRPESSELPADFRAAVDALAGPRPLVPVAVLVTARVERDLVAGAWVRAHLAEDTVTAVVEGEEASWHEVETELVPGEPLATLDALETALLAVGATRAPHGSKVGRALTDAVARPRRVPGRDTAAGELLGYAAKQVGTLQSLAAGVRADAPDAVHKTRVACRRLRSLLRTYGPLFEPQRTDRLAEELQWFGEIAGGPRDAEVLKEHLLEALATLDPGTVHGPVAERLVADLDRLHADAHDRLVAVMAGERYRALHRSLVELLTDPPLRASGLRPARLALPGPFERAVERVRERHAKALRKPAELERWHQVRKAAKAARYSAEALADVNGDAARDHAALFEAVTEALGEVQDTVVAHDTLGHLEAEAAARGEPTLTYRVLQQRQLDKRAAALRAGRAALDVALAADRGWLS
jgi:CHAD domain-containing protein